MNLQCNSNMEVCGQVEGMLDSKSEGLGFDFHCTPCEEVWANFVFHTALVHPAIMVTWCTGSRLDQYL